MCLASFASHASSGLSIQRLVSGLPLSMTTTPSRQASVSLWWFLHANGDASFASRRISVNGHVTPPGVETPDGRGRIGRKWYLGPGLIAARLDAYLHVLSFSPRIWLSCRAADGEYGVAVASLLGIDPLGGPCPDHSFRRARIRLLHPCNQSQPDTCEPLALLVLGPLGVAPRTFDVAQATPKVRKRTCATSKNRKIERPRLSRKRHKNATLIRCRRRS